jgi:hypothetical protein
MNDIPTNSSHPLWEQAMNYFLEKVLIIGILLFSLLVKGFELYRKRDAMSKIEIYMDMTLTGLGSSIAIYCLSHLNLPLWLFCLCGGFSGVFITPLATKISLEAAPFVNDAVDWAERWVKKIMSKKEQQ